MRYIITQGQLHQIVYKYLDNIFENSDSEKIQNPYNPDAYRINLKVPKKSETISYFYYGPGEYDDDTKHYGIGSLHIHPDIVDTIRKLVGIRETKVVDIVTDWFSEKFEVDVDEISIYPERKTPAVY